MRTLRTWFGELDVTKVGQFVAFDVLDYTVLSVQAEPRSSTTVGAWEATVKRDAGGSPQDFSTAIKFTSSILILGEKDITGSGRITVTNSVSGTSGMVDLWIVVKAGD